MRPRLRNSGGPHSVGSILGLPEEQCCLGWLMGFGRAECTAVAEHRVLDVLTNQLGLSSDPASDSHTFDSLFPSHVDNCAKTAMA